MEWSDSQKRAIFEQGNLIVSAAAGAGKTTVLSERICSAVISVCCALAGMLVSILCSTPVGSTIVAADMLVLPTPPFPATAMIFVSLSI